MVRVNVAYRFRAARCVFVGAGYVLLNACLAQTEEEAPALQLDPAPVADVAKQQATPERIEWAGVEYQVPEGVQILIRVCSDSNADPDDTAAALRKLGEVAPLLRGTTAIVRLVELYEVTTRQEARRALIGCIAASDDERGLPFFTGIVANTTDEVQRFQAAYALARWNVRTGVRELIGLFDSSIAGPDGRRFGEQVVKVFQLLNLQKNWGAPDQEILQRIRESDPELRKEQVLSRYGIEIQQWFAENEHRFPDWQPDDPLPEVEANDQPQP